jgi:hypothetical protein
VRDIDLDELEEDRKHRFNQRLQRRLINPDRDYPDNYHRQDVLEGIVDISEGEE